MARLGKQRDVQRDEVGFAKQPVEVGKLGAQFPFDLERRAIRIVVEHAHLKTLRAAGQAAADPAESDNAERLAPNVAAEKLIEIPSGPGA